MTSFCLKCKKDTKDINPRVSNVSNGKTMVLSKCTICNSKNKIYYKSRSKRTVKQFRCWNTIK